jgi:hypothetical protein
METGTIKYPPLAVVSLMIVCAKVSVGKGRHTAYKMVARGRFNRIGASMKCVRNFYSRMTAAGGCSRSDPDAIQPIHADLHEDRFGNVER